MKRLVLLLITCLCIINAHAAYLKDIPVTVTQPDGTVLHCFVSGDEFFNYLHDSKGYTIIQHPQTGFYVYAEIRDGNLTATTFIAGQQDPASKGLQPYALISPEEWMAKRRIREVPDNRPNQRDDNPNHGTLNNISIFIRFSDDEEFVNNYHSIDNMFNDVTDNAISLKSYFRAASYGAIEINTYFYPGHDDETIISYRDTYPRSYFEPYNATTNTNGYQNDDESREREFSLLERAVKYINANYPVPTDLNIDYDNDGYIDNICFIVRGGTGEWGSLLWPHKWTLYDRAVYINSKRVWTFNFQLADATGYFNTSTMCHEMNHSLGAPDLYHYSYTGPDAVGIWDLMHANTTPPQHCGAYMKMKYGHWVDDIPEITQAGVYTLNPISSNSPTNIAYKIPTDDPNQFYVLEYRDKTSLFETGLPGSGLLVYRIDTRFGGNASYDPSNGVYDEVYIFRPEGSTSNNGDLYSAYFSAGVGRTEFNASTSAYPFFTDGTIDNNFSIYNITSAGSTISFTYGSSSNCEAPTNLVASLEDNNVTLSWNAANNAVSYNIYKDGSLLGNTVGTTYSDNSIPYGKYSYFLKSVDSNGLLSTASETVVVSYLPEDAFIIGEGGTATYNLLPSYSYYNYSLTQQIYTAEELGEAGLITKIAFFNGGAKKTRTYNFYLFKTAKDSFSSETDWETVTNADKVFSGSVTMNAGGWTMITLDTPYYYDGTSNLVLVSDDNTGGWTNSPHMSCRVFNATGQALRVYGDDTNYDPLAPSSYTGTVENVKNQLLLVKVNEEPQVDYYTIGDGSDATDKFLPSYSYYNHTLSQQIYTTDELGEPGIITSIAFYNGGTEKTRLYDFYMIATDKTVFDTDTDWVAVSTGDKVFSGSVTMVANDWTVITFSNPFFYDGTSNVILVTDDNTGSYSDGMKCRVFNAPSQALRVYGDYTDFNPMSPPSSYNSNENAAIMDVKNQLRFTKEEAATGPFNITVIANPEQGGIVTGNGVYNFGETCTVTATANLGYYFVGWIEDGQMVSTDTELSFTVVQDRAFVAMFGEGLLIGDGGMTTSNYLPSHSYYNHSLTQQIYTADEIGTAGIINSIAFYNGGTEKTRVYDMYLVLTDKTDFESQTDWIAVKETDKVFSGTVNMVSGNWTVFILDTPFMYDGINNLALIMDDNTNSYSQGMACRVFNTESNQALRIYNDNIDYDPFEPFAYDGTLMTEKNQILLDITITYSTQTTALTEGWNWFSTFIKINNAEDGLVMLKESLGENGVQIKSTDSYTSYDDGEWFGDLDDEGIFNEKMYRILVGTNCTVTLTGIPANPANHAITVNPGWNWIGFPCGEAVSIEAAFANFDVEEGDMIKTRDENTSFEDGEWLGDIEEMVPGMGYMYLSNNSETKTLIYQTGNKK